MEAYKIKLGRWQTQEEIYSNQSCWTGDKLGMKFFLIKMVNTLTDITKLQVQNAQWN